jgi:predicted small lipoprotein YifL
LVIFLLFLAISCGRKGALENPPDYARPDFGGVIEDR